MLQVQEACREARQSRFLASLRALITSVRSAMKQLRASPVFAATVVLTCALGIGSTTAIFTSIDAVMLRPLPVPDPARLYRIGDGDDTTAEGRHGRWGFFSFPLYERLKAAAPEFEEITAFGLAKSVERAEARNSRRGQSVARRIRHRNVLSTLGVFPHSGHLFFPDDDRQSAPPVAVISHHAWRGLYGGDASLVGATLVVQGHPFEVIGVAAPDF